MVFTGSFDTIGSITYVVTLLPLDLLYCITVGVNFDTLSYFAFPLWFVQLNRDVRSLLVCFPIKLIILILIAYLKEMVYAMHLPL